jgi:hypothetical protein
MGMAITYDSDALPRTTCYGGHGCRFSGHKRTSPAGGNRHNVSVIVAECSCGKLRAKFPEKLSYWDKRWIARVNHRIDCQNTTIEARRDAVASDECSRAELPTDETA